MKKCLQCEQVYGDETNFCLSDGAALVSVSGSTGAAGEMPTVYSGYPPPTDRDEAPAPTFQGGAPFIPPVSSAPAESGGGRTFLIVAAVGLIALVAGGAAVGLIIYGLSRSNKDNTNVANVSNTGDKTNKNTSAEQKPGSDDRAQKLKEQQEKLDKDRQKLEEERKALENKKKDAEKTTPPASATTATIVDPPSNVRASPNGAILCVLRRRGTTVNITGATGVTDNNGSWYHTDVCGREGVIHSSQIKF